MFQYDYAVIFKMKHLYLLLFPSLFSSSKSLGDFMPNKISWRPTHFLRVRIYAVATDHCCVLLLLRTKSLQRPKNKEEYDEDDPGEHKRMPVPDKV